MNSYYILIKIITNTASKDKTTVGIFSQSGDKIFLKFSDRKISIAQRYSEIDNKIIGYFRKQFENRVKEFRNKSSEEARIFSPELILSSEFFQSLRKNSNNLISFSEPSTILGEITEDKFENLYAVYVDKLEKELQTSENTQNRLYENVTQKLIYRVQEKVHTNYELNKKIIPSIYFNLSIDCLGKNGSVIAAKSFDLERSYGFVDKEIMHYSFVTRKLFDEWGNEENKSFVIADEPDSKSSENYKLWEAINNESSFSIVSSEEVTKIAELIEERNAQKFLPFKDNN